jgi:sugar lactone lactonase YvrE
VLSASHVKTVGARLGEGPVWVRRDRALWYTDILGRKVHRFCPATGLDDAWDAPAAIGWVLPTTDGDFIAGLAKGIYRFSPGTGKFALFHSVETELPNNRLNDAATDLNGRVWFGTMDDAEVDCSGRFYLLDQGRVSTCAIEPMCITNGPAVSPDGRTLYAVDTQRRALNAYTIGSDGYLSGRRTFLTVSPELGYPDGSICDAAGNVWVAFWQGWAARRYTPDGTLTHEVRFPVANVTKIALGGADGRTAFATTASKGLSPEALAQQPMAGDLFTFDVDVPGNPVREIHIPLL